MLQQSEQRRKSDLLRTLTASSRDTSSSKKRPAKEKLTVEEELEKCIQDFRKIKIPERFPERKYMWQADLLRKYRLWAWTAETGGKQTHGQGSVYVFFCSWLLQQVSGRQKEDKNLHRNQTEPYKTIVDNM